ncbi:MAG: hypothetical protein Q9161_008380 [Pseudevernia consocians]
MKVDYRVRKHVFCCLKLQATNYQGNLEDLERELEIVRNAAVSYNDTINRLKDGGFHVQMEYSGEYERAGILEASVAECVREMRDVERVLGRLHPVIGELKYVRASYDFRKDEFERAEILFREVKVQLEYDPDYGHEDIGTLNVVTDLAEVLTELIKYEAAEEMYNRALSGFEKLLGPSHPRTLECIDGLASLCQSQGKYKNAEALCHQALEGETTVLGESHENTLETLNTLGIILRSQGKYEEAMEVFHRALRLTKSVSGSEHTSVLGTKEALAVAIGAQGDHRRAEEMTRHVIAKRKEVLGPEHVDTLAAMGNLAALLTRQRKLKAAANLLTQVLQTREKLLGEASPSTLKNIHDLAFVLAA